MKSFKVTHEKAMSEDSETKQRFEWITTKIVKNNYVCRFTSKDYSGYGGKKANTNQPEQQEPTVNYRDQTPNQLHYTLVKKILSLKEKTDQIMKKNPQKSTTSYIGLPT